MSKRYEQKKQIFFRNNILFFTLLAVALLVVLQAINFSFNLNYKAYNGAFKTFNPLKRMFFGELPGRDFNPYLGLRTTYLTAVITYFFGGNFAASKLSIYLLSVLFHLLVLTTLFLSGLSIKKSVIAASFVFMIISYNLHRLALFWELAGSGNNDLYLRSALPFITSWIVLLLLKSCQKTPQKFYCSTGYLIGIQPLWSNDYGIPSSVALRAIIINLIKKENNKIIKSILLFTSAAIAFFTVAS